jgi:hypothetical protein
VAQRALRGPRGPHTELHTVLLGAALLDGPLHAIGLPITMLHHGHQAALFHPDGGRLQLRPAHLLAPPMRRLLQRGLPENRGLARGGRRLPGYPRVLPSEASIVREGARSEHRAETLADVLRRQE